MRVFCIAGYSNSGKTTLISEAVRVLSARGYRVATIKSSKEDIYPPKGSDTFKHMEAGAITSVFLGPSSSIVRYTHRINLNALQDIDADYLLIEGMKDSNIPKIWCTSTQIMNTETIAPGTVAIVSWEKDEGADSMKNDIPIFNQSDIDGIIQVIEKFSIDIHELDRVLRET